MNLLKEQISSRKDMLIQVQEEQAGAEAAKEDLVTEYEQLDGQLQTLTEELTGLVEKDNVLFARVEEIEQTIQALDTETEMLTFGLHETDNQGESLQKECALMKQQLDGHYQGSIRDWADEVSRLKIEAEVQRTQDELEHWKNVVEETEREMSLDQRGNQQVQQYTDLETQLQHRLQQLTDEVARRQQRLKDLLFSQSNTDSSSGAVHSVPAPLHGLIQPPPPLPPELARRRKALIVGCNYSKSHAPLNGCSNDVWNLQCLLRHSFRYEEGQVRILIDGSQHCPSPANRQPTKANIVAGLRWLTQNAGPGDNLLFFFCGYGTQQPLMQADGLYQAHLLPCDFAHDLPRGFFSSGPPVGGSGANGDAAQAAHFAARAAQAAQAGCTYRLVPLAEISITLANLPAGCKMTVVLDCCHSVIPKVSATNPSPTAFPKATPDVNPFDFIRPREAGVRSSMLPRYIELPPLPTPASPVAAQPPVCCCHCYSACQGQDWCSELLIEGCVQGAFTWAFVKALTAGHLDTTVQQHNKALDGILADLRHRFKWLDQTHVLQLSGSATLHDQVLLP